MRSKMWLILLLVFEVRGDHYTTHYVEKNCDKYKDDEIKYKLASSGRSSSAVIKATNNLSYSYPFNCNITVSVRNNDDAHVLLRVRKISFPLRTDCKNYVKIYESKGSYQLCDKDDIRKHDFTRKDSEEMKFLYHTEFYSGKTYGLDDDFFKTGFEILATAYTLAPCGKDLNFLCDNGRCISNKLVRDGYDNCGDNSDEYKYSIRIRLPVRTVVGIAIGILLLIAAISGAVWLFRRKQVTSTRIYTTPTQPLYPTGAQPYSQTPVSHAQYSPAPYPSVPGVQNPYGGEPYPQYGGVTNPNYGQPPPPPYQ